VFTAYSPSHLVVLALFAIGTVGLLVYGPRVRGTPAERRVAVWFAVGNLVFGAISLVQGLVPFDVESSLPLQICGFGWLVIAAALLTVRPTLTALTYYWGLTFAVQALVQPTLTQPFPQPEFFVFFLKHALMVCVGLPASSEGNLEFNPFMLFAKDTTIIYSAVGTVEDMRELVHLAAQGKVKSHISRTGALTELPTIFDELEAAQYTGRAVLTDLAH